MISAHSLHLYRLQRSLKIQLSKDMLVLLCKKDYGSAVFTGINATSQSNLKCIRIIGFIKVNSFLFYFNFKSVCLCVCIGDSTN